MNVTAVESSTLATIGYDATGELLQLEFSSGALYQYFHVSATVHEALVRAPSKGSFSIRRFGESSRTAGFPITG